LSATTWRRFPENPVANTMTSALTSVPSLNQSPSGSYDIGTASDLTLI
jgi:hypothetical protein